MFSSFLSLDIKDGPLDTSPTSSPLPKLDDKIAASFPTGKPREQDLLETVICKHCKRPVLKSTAPDHIRGCLKAKQEKARKKKEARDAANRAKAGDVGDIDEKEGGEDSMKGQKSAKKSAVKGTDDGTKKGKKRKADEDDTKPKKKKKDEPKAKTAKPKGPVDVEKQCGVTLPNGAQCARSLTCKSHSMGAKRGVPGRSLPYDMLLQQYQKKNQARQQSMCFLTLSLSLTAANIRTNMFSFVTIYRSRNRRQCPITRRSRNKRTRRFRRRTRFSHGSHCPFRAKAPGRTYTHHIQDQIQICPDQRADAACHRRTRWWLSLLYR